MNSYWLLRLQQTAMKRKRRHRWWVHPIFQKQKGRQTIPPSCSWTGTGWWQFSSLFPSDKRIACTASVLIEPACVHKLKFCTQDSMERKLFSKVQVYSLASSAKCHLPHFTQLPPSHRTCSSISHLNSPGSIQPGCHFWHTELFNTQASTVLPGIHLLLGWESVCVSKVPCLGAQCWSIFSAAGDWTRDLLLLHRTRYHWAMTPNIYACGYMETTQLVCLGATFFALTHMQTDTDARTDTWRQGFKRHNAKASYTFLWLYDAFHYCPYLALAWNW